MPVVRVSLSGPLSSELLLRHFPGRVPRWGEFSFDLAGAEANPDYWVVLHDLQRPERCRCAPSRTVLLFWEPSAICRCGDRFTSQFGAVVTCQASLRHPRVLLHQPGLPWWAGIRMESGAEWRAVADYDFFKAAVLPEKADRISVINSGKRMVAGHEARGRFVAALKERFGDRVELFGRDSRPVADKLDAIAPFKYHLAIENSVEPHYWSEKLADAFLGDAMPIYCGCPNVSEYFPADSICRIDVRDHAAALRSIEAALASDAFSRTAALRAAAREQLMDQHNLFAFLARVLPTLPPAAPRAVTLRPRGDLERPIHGRIKRRVRRTLEGLSRRGA
jgi:hypothetical protein